MQYISRRKTRKIKLGNIEIGGDAPVSIQSMTNTDTKDAEATIKQINELEKVGCEIIRIAIPNKESADKITIIKNNIHIPLIADIHFSCELALQSIENGVDGIRINPGNIKVKNVAEKIVNAAKKKNIPIRIGVNSGSLEKDLQKKYGVTPTAIVQSALRYIRILENLDFYNMKISLKSSSVPMTIASYRLLAGKVDYPFHLGITEAGTSFAGTIKSAIGIGTLLAEGIGDTIRVSLTENPIEEIKVAKQILQSLDLRKGPDIIACPTCGRTEIDIINITKEVEKEIHKLNIQQDIKIAVMGCIVNGPGEAKEADIGIAGGRNEGLLFKNGKAIRKIPESELVKTLIQEIKKMTII
ncbi:MAG: 4-hydroxy-3-methylbut-2-en-1-yl diphosphate synthase [Candidatus Cloacimonadota bacterium]|nr:MAG: 4-hydroxy-3-methylbut-2-en-1-yl diphosphate synthase [Candidatus Cloacimonadota bacterium]